MANNEFNIDDYLPKATTQDTSQQVQPAAFNIDDYLGVQGNDVTGLGEKQAVDFATQLANFPSASPVQQYMAFEQYGNQYKDHLTQKGYSGDQIAQMMAEFSTKADPRNQTSEYEYYIGDRGKEVMVGSGNLTGDALAVVPESIPVIGSLADQAEKYVKDTTKAWKNAKSARSQIQTYLGNKAEIEALANGASEFSALMANLKENPMQIVSLITEQAPQLLLGGMGKAALTGVNVAGGAGRVRSDIEEAYETTAKENPSQLLQLPEIKDRMANGMSFEEAVNDAKTDITDNWNSIVAGAVIGGTEAFTPLGKFGQGVNRGVLKTLGKEVGQEAFQEGAEQLNSNLAVGSIDGKTQAFDNVIRNSTLGGIAGLGTGIPTAIEAGLNKNTPIQTQAQTSLNDDEQTIQQETIQPEQPNTETNQPEQAIENPQQNANSSLDETALSKALAGVDEESHAEFQQRLERDLANGKAENRKSGKYGKFVQDYLAVNAVPEVVRQQQQAEQEQPTPQENITQGQPVNNNVLESILSGYKELESDINDGLIAQRANDNTEYGRLARAYLAQTGQEVTPQQAIENPQTFANQPIQAELQQSANIEPSQSSVEVDNEADVTNLESNVELENAQDQLEQTNVNSEQTANTLDLEAEKLDRVLNRNEWKEGEDYNQYYQRLQKDADKRRLERTQTITQNNGKAFRNEKSATEALNRYSLEDTHKVQQDSTGKGYVLERKTPAEYRTDYDRKNNIPTRAEAESQAVSELGLSDRWVEDEDGEYYDLTPEEQKAVTKRMLEIRNSAYRKAEENGAEYRMSHSPIKSVDAFDLKPTDEQVGSNDPNLPMHSLPTRQRQGMGTVGTDNVQQFTQQRNSQIAQDQATLSRILGEKTAAHIQVVDSNTQVPTGQNVKKLAANGVEGWFDVSSQKLYIISDNITANEVLSRDERLAWVAFHELSHAGVRIKFGPILTNVLASAGKNVVVKVLARKIQAEYGYTQEVATEEAMAEIYAAFETGNWAELESRYKVKIHHSYKQGKDSVGDFLTKAANILRRLIGGIVGKDLTQAMTTSQVFETLRGIQQGVNDIANFEQNQTASGEGNRYSLNESKDSEFAQAVEAIENGDNPASAKITLGTTPDVLRMLGIDDGNVIITARTLRKDMVGKHKVSPEAMKQLPQQLNDPIAVVHSRPDSTNPEAYLMLTELTEVENGKELPVIAALDFVKNKDGDFELVEIASAYGRKNVKVAKDLLYKPYYWNKAKGNHFLKNFSLSPENSELLSELRTSFLSDDYLSARNIKTEADLSQYQMENYSVRYSQKPQDLSQSAYDQAKENGETELTFQQWKQVRSPEFKRWFGDWENDPDNASKVVNPRTGEPLVVYHGTDAEFYTFDRNELGKETFNNASNLYYAMTAAVGHWFNSQNLTETINYGDRSVGAFLNIRDPERFGGVDELAGDIEWSGFVPDDKRDVNDFDDTWEINEIINEYVEHFKEARYSDGLIVKDEEYGGISYVAFDSNQIKSATDNNGEFSTENEDIRYSRKQSAMETANAKQVNQHPNAWARVKNGGFAQFKKEMEKARAFIDTKVHDRLRPVMDWIDGIEVQGLSAYEKSQLKDSIYAAEGIKSDIIVQAELKYLNPIRDDIAAIAKKYFNGDGETALKKAGFWISTRWAIEKNAQMLKADYDAMIESEQEYNDAVAHGEPMNVQDRLERAFIKAENQYYNRKADVESRDFSDDRKYKVGTAGGWSTPLAKAIMAKMESQIPRAELEALAERVYDLNEWKLKQDLESGRFTVEEVERFKQDRHYVPLTGDPSMELDDMLRMPSNRNPNVAKDKGMQGRKLSEADDAITAIWESVAKTATYNGWQPMKAHFAKLYDQAYQEAISNGLSQKAAADEATEKTGISKQKMQGLTRTSDNVLIYKENGNYYELSLPEKAMEQIKKQNSDNTPAPLRPVQAATGWLARGVTQFKPHFAMVNMVRDLWEKSEFVRTKEIFDKNGNPLSEEVKNQIGREIWQQAMRAIAGQNTDVWKAAKRYAMKQGLRDNVPAERELKTLLKNGGVSTHSTLLERKETDLIKTINKRNSSLAKGIEKAIRAVEIYNGIFDIVSSISANRALLKYGVEPKHASAVTLDLTNFRKQGDWMPFIKSFYMFAQPAAIGGANLIKMMGTKTGRVRLLKGALFFGALSFILRSIADEDEDGNAFAKEGDKDRFIPIPIGEYNFKLPVGYGAPQLMWNMGYNITEAIMGDKTWGDAAASTMLHAFKAVTPVSPSEVPVSEYPGTKLLMTLTPTIAQPIVQNVFNRNAFGSQLANSYINDKSLKAEQGKMNTAPFWTETALWLNDTFGMDFAPEHVKNFAQGYANIVPLMNETLTILVENPNKARLGKPESVPFINAVVGPKNPYATQSQFYRFRDEANDTVKNFNSRKERGTLPESWKTDPEIRWQRNWFAKVEEMEKLQRKVKSNLTRLHNEGKLSTEVYQERLNNLAKDTEAKQRKLVGIWRFHNGLNTTATRD
ncbi:LPD38 domain-containing protein [Mannheimia varigena]|uniref:LPD38 domain-containing protein n=1 Tax=Mannheimia varigena TaxID=85404 RepID=UPI0015B7499D|nr:LPD38 domain-containing protein [Mannheimia varigena]QLD33155.1 hypothetical protein A6B42_04975 [Mannheimia varigena]